MNSHSRNEIKIGAVLGPEIEKLCSRISELTIDHELRVHGGPPEVFPVPFFIESEMP